MNIKWGLKVSRRAKYTPQQIANFFIKKAKEQNVELTKIKLMKLIYIAYAWYLAHKNEDLFDEPIEAWKCGKVVPSIYNELRKTLGNRVSSYVQDQFINNSDIQEDKVLRICLDGPWQLYKNMDDFQLVATLHEEDSPWFKVYKPNQNNIVNTEENKPLIKQGAYKGIEKLYNLLGLR